MPEERVEPAAGGLPERLADWLSIDTGKFPYIRREFHKTGRDVSRCVISGFAYISGTPPNFADSVLKSGKIKFYGQNACNIAQWLYFCMG